MRAGEPDSRVSAKRSMIAGRKYWLEVLCVGSGGCAVGARVHGSRLVHPVARRLVEVSQTWARQPWLRPYATHNSTSSSPLASSRPARQEAAIESQRVEIRKAPQREVRRVTLSTLDALGATFKLTYDANTVGDTVNQVLEYQDGIGGPFGRCTCPDGQIYFVGSYQAASPSDREACQALACHFGTPSTLCDHLTATSDPSWIPDPSLGYPFDKLKGNGRRVDCGRRWLSDTLHVQDSAAEFRRKLQPLIDAQDGVQCILSATSAFRILPPPPPPPPQQQQGEEVSMLMSISSLTLLRSGISSPPLALAVVPVCSTCGCCVCPRSCCPLTRLIAGSIIPLGSAEFDPPPKRLPLPNACHPPTLATGAKGALRPARLIDRHPLRRALLRQALIVRLRRQRPR